MSVYTSWCACLWQLVFDTEGVGFLRQVWSATAEAAQGEASETGALSRLHSALIAVVTHVVTRLGSRALGDPQVSGYLRGL